MTAHFLLKTAATKSRQLIQQISSTDSMNCLQAIHIRYFDIRNDQIRLFQITFTDQRATRHRGHNPVSLIRRHPAEKFTHVGFIIRDCNAKPSVQRWILQVRKSPPTTCSSPVALRAARSLLPMQSPCRTHGKFFCSNYCVTHGT